MIFALLKEKRSIRYIAQQLHRNPGTISREVKRGTTTQLRSDLTTYEAYFPETGQAVYAKHRSASGFLRKLHLVEPFLQFAETKILRDKWSPDAVVGYCRSQPEWLDKELVCTKTLYNYIDQCLLKTRNLDLLVKVRRKTKRQVLRKNKRILGQSIELRPAEVENRQEFGHWEIDTVIGQRTAGEVLLTLDERLTRRRHIRKISGKTKAGVAAGLDSLRQTYGAAFAEVFKSITSDNGSEFSGLAEAFPEGRVYFAHPYASCERGTNEKQNSLVRRFVPKGKDISTVSDYTVQKTEDWINHLPRKMFNYRTPEELFQEHLQRIAPVV